MRGEEMAPGLWVKVQVAKLKRNRDQRIFAPLCLGSNHRNRKPCPALAETLYRRAHTHTHARARTHPCTSPCTHTKMHAYVRGGKSTY